jgi:hypothetical protein
LRLTIAIASGICPGEHVKWDRYNKNQLREILRLKGLLEGLQLDVLLGSLLGDNIDVGTNPLNTKLWVNFGSSLITAHIRTARCLSFY